MTALRLHRPGRPTQPVLPPVVLDADRNIDRIIRDDPTIAEPARLLAIVHDMLLEANRTGRITRYDLAVLWRLSLRLRAAWNDAAAPGYAAVNALLATDDAALRAVAKEMLRRDYERRRVVAVTIKGRLQRAFEAGKRVAYRQFMSLTAAYKPKRGA